jgi:lysophospholipase L1-like esterase
MGTWTRAIVSILAICLCVSNVHAVEPLEIPNHSRIVFLGDSNTFAGKFIAYFQYHLMAERPNDRFDLINLGLPSETVSGLSEPDHPYPRPDVHTRLAKALELTKPNIVVACYGMNDGIYYPFEEKRFAAYRAGYEKLIDACEKAGAKVVLMTPAPFDAKPLGNKVLAKGADKYSWMRPYENYDSEVLAEYAKWLVGLRAKGKPVVDAHSAVLKHLQAMRRVDENYRVSGDGIHPDANGHAIVFRELLSAFQTTVGKTITVNPKSLPSTEVLKFEQKEKEATLTLKLNPAFRIDAGWHKRFLEIEPFDATIRRQSIIVAMPDGNFGVSEGEKKLGSFSAQQMAKGINLATLKELSLNVDGAKAAKLVDEATSVYGLAWLTHVGHNRPDTPKGIALEMASTIRKDKLEEAAKLLGTREVTIKLLAE